MLHPSHWKLRVRLAILVALLTIGAIAVVSVATYQALQGSLIDRVDGQLDQAVSAPPPFDGPPRRGDRRPPRGEPGRRSLPTGTWSALYEGGYGDGTLKGPDEEILQGTDSSEIKPSQRPSQTLTQEQLKDLLAGPVTVSAQTGNARFRMAARRLGGDDIMMVAIPLTEVDATLSKLLRIEFIVGAIASIGIALVAMATIRAGLRPLEAIAAAASEVASESSGDGHTLGRRVPATEAAETEVGQLAAALNSMLERIDESFAAQSATQQQLRQFVADASHELRTPLTSIQGFAELARTRGDQMSAEEREHALRRVEEESQHLGHLVEDMLLLSRLDEGLPLHPQPSDIAAIAASAVDAARVIEPEREVTLSSSGAGPVSVDPVRVRQLLDNLLTNVRTHAGPGAAAHVTVEQSESGATITVTDSGRGLSAAQRELALDRFWRADNARTRASGGSGLGLAIVGAIARAHGGEVELLDAPERGSGLSVRVHLSSI